VQRRARSHRQRSLWLLAPLLFLLSAGGRICPCALGARAGCGPASNGASDAVERADAPAPHGCCAAVRAAPAPARTRAPERPATPAPCCCQVEDDSAPADLARAAALGDAPPLFAADLAPSAASRATGRAPAARVEERTRGAPAPPLFLLHCVHRR
jgi:hypothetical protein